MNKEFTVEIFGGTYPGFYIDEPARAQSFINKMMESDHLFGVDTETAAVAPYLDYPKAALNPYYSEIRLLQIFTGKAVVVFDLRRINHNEIFIPFLENKRFIAHNAVFELQFFRRMGVKKCNIGCSMLAAKLLIHAKFPDDGQLGAGLDDLVQVVLDTKIPKTVQASDWGNPHLTFEQIKYAAIDAIATYKVAEKLAVGLKKHGLLKVYNLYKEVMHPVVSMQLNGMKLDVQAHRKLMDEWMNDLFKARKEVIKVSGVEKITPHSIADYLETGLDAETLSMWPRTDTGKLSTDADALSTFSYLPIVEPFSNFQKLSKLTTAFGMRLINQVNRETGRIHGQYKIAGARTGRFSCSQPNIQQSPRDKKFRDNFVAGDGRVIVRADFNQIELRCAAEISGDKNMLAVYRDGKDLHKLTASNISGRPYASIGDDDPDRQRAKAVNFGFLFGLGAKKFSAYARKSYRVEVSRADALHAIEKWRDLYVDYYEWQMERATEAASTLMTTTALGKLRRLNPENTYGTSANNPVQGSAGECMQASLVLVDKRLTSADKLVGCVHDEILVECEKDRAQEICAILETEMTNGYRFVFPNGIVRGLVDAKYGESWASAKSGSVKKEHIAA